MIFHEFQKLIHVAKHLPSTSRNLTTCVRFQQHCQLIIYANLSFIWIKQFLVQFFYYNIIKYLLIINFQSYFFIYEP